MTILVLGGSGKTGGAALRALSDIGVHAVCLARRKDARSDAIASLGHAVAFGDMRNPDDLRTHVRAAETIYFTLPFGEDAIACARTLAEVLETEAPKSVVYLTQWLASEHHPAPMTRACWQAEILLRYVRHRSLVIVEPGMFADNFLKGIYWAMSTGLFLHAIPAGRSAPVSNDDIGAVVAKLLLSPGDHDGRRYRPEGPALLDASGMASEIGSALGRRVFSRRVPYALFEKSALALGVSEAEIYNFRFYMHEHGAGAFSLSTGRNNAVLELTGRPPQTFSDIAKRYADDFTAVSDRATRLRQNMIFLFAPFLRSATQRADPGSASGIWVQNCPEWSKTHAVVQRA